MRVHFVAKARKDNRAVNKGEPYYWWKPRYGGKRYSATRPKPSQLSSGRKAEVMACQEDFAEALDGATTYDDIRAVCEDTANRLRELGDEYREGVYNMPENLQDGDQAQRMNEMADGLDAQADELESLDFEGPEEFDDPEPVEPNEDKFDDEDEFEEAFDDWESDHEEWKTDKEDRENEIENFIEDLKSSATDIVDSIEFQF